MKKMFFMLAFMLIGSFALANNEIKPVELVTKNVKVEKSSNTNVTVKEETALIAQVICTRTCYYKNGDLIGCTAWDCRATLSECVVTP